MPKPAVNPKPYAWVEPLAWDFPTIMGAIVRYNKSKVPNEMIAVIFFEETCFVNRQQTGGKGGPAAGFGQLEVGNRDKVRFYDWLREADIQPSDLLLSELDNQVLSPAALREKMSLQEKVKTKVLGSKDYSVQFTCKYFQYLSDAANKDVAGIITAQIGTHFEYRKRFQRGYEALKAAMSKTGLDQPSLRTEYINALNLAKQRQEGEADGTKQNPIPEKNFTLFWDWVLPPEWLCSQAAGSGTPAATSVAA